MCTGSLFKTLRTVFLSLVMASSSLSWCDSQPNNQFVTLTFQQDSGQGMVPVDNPVIGKRVILQESEADWAFEEGTRLNFIIDTTLVRGNLVFELRDIAPHAGLLPQVGPGEPQPVYVPPTVFWSHTIAINATTVGTQQFVDIPVIGALANQDPNRVYYFGIYSTGGDLYNEVTARFNNTDVGTAYHTLSDAHPPFNLPLLYFHPDHNPEPAIVTPETISNEFQKFVPIPNPSNPSPNDLFHGRPIWKATAGWRYRLGDNDQAGGGAGSRVWSFYKIGANDSLTLVGHFPGLDVGQPSSGAQYFPGALCDVIPPDPGCPTNPSPICTVTQKFLVRCTRVDARGATSAGPINLNDLDEDVFVYEVGPDLTTISPPSWLISRQHANGAQTPLALENFLFPYSEGNKHVWVKPWGHNYGAWAQTHGSEYRIQYKLNGSATWVEEPSNPEEWRIHATTNNNSLVPSHFLPIYGRGPGGQLVQGDSNNPDDLPIQIQWKIRTPFGETGWSDTSVIHSLQPLPVPELDVTWPAEGSILAPGSTFKLQMMSQPPQQGISYFGTYSVWLYDPANPEERQIRLTIGGTYLCQIRALDATQQDSWSVPTDLGWDVTTSDRLAIRVKHLWHQASSTVQCQNASLTLDNFSAITTDSFPNAVAGKADSEHYRGAIPGSSVSSTVTEDAPVVFDPSGGVNFGLNLDPTSTAIPTRITWKWRNTVTNQVWRNGEWESSSAPESQIWPLGDSSDGFAQRWQWNAQQAQVEARYRSGGAPAPFTPIGVENLLQNFFQGQASVGVVVDVKVEFQDGSTAETTTNAFTVRPSFSSEIVTAMVMKADGQQLSHLYGRAGTLPNLEWTVTTSTALPNQVQVGIFKQGGTQIACETLENATSLFTQIMPSNGPNGKIYTLTAQSGSELFNLLSTQGAGRYEIRFSGAACSGGDWSSAQVALITLNPNLAFRLRFHYRDHLGSSTVSRAYTPEYQTGIAGTATFNLKMSALGNQFVTLYAQPEKTTNFTPFGKPMGDVNEEPNPRYTDHEFDAESGLNYMKGRYQLANFAKFNRPDPMRDWDWENPSSINLYQYVRNNPIDSWDPDGFQERGMTTQAYKDDVAKVQRVQETVREAKSEGKNTLLAVANANPGATFAATEFIPVLELGLIALDIRENGLSLGNVTDSILAMVPFLPNGLRRGAKNLEKLDDATDANRQANRATNDLDGGGSGFVDLTDEKGKRHILDGDETGGGHRAGTGKPGKSEFPAEMSDEEILNNISDVATDPNSTYSNATNGRTIVTGTRDGVDIKVVIENPEKGERIVTGYPTNLPRNPKKKE